MLNRISMHRIISLLVLCLGILLCAGNLWAQDGTIAWSYSPGGPVYGAPAIGDDGTIYFGSDGNYLYALNSNGTLKWRFETDGIVQSAPTIGSDGTIYVGSADGHLYAVNPDGTQKWAYDTGGSVDVSPALGSDGTVYAPSASTGSGIDEGDVLHAVRPNGTLKWSYQMDKLGSSAPVIAQDGTIYFATSFDLLTFAGGDLVALTSAGALKWKYSLAGFGTSTPALGEDGTVYLVNGFSLSSSSSFTGVLLAISPNGAKKWSYEFGWLPLAAPAIGNDGVVYVGSDDGKLLAINTDGSLKWSFETGDWIYSDPAIGADGTIVFGSSVIVSLENQGGKVYAVTANGTEKWSQELSGGASTAVAIGSDGTVYVGASGGISSDSGTLYAIEGSSGGLADSGWPMFQRDLKHTGRAASVEPPVPTPTFEDVPESHWAYDYIETLYASEITTGCSTNPLEYCPNDSVTRAQMAVFLERGIQGSGFQPPSATGIFDDVPASYWASGWIEQLYDDGVTTGCGSSPLRYCPEDTVTRAQMAVFLLRAEHGASYTPPSAAGVFTDVPVGYWAAPWIEQLYSEEITSGCSTGPLMYCPENPVTRAEMAVFLVKTFALGQ